MALTDKLTAIADSIRSKTGKTDLLTLDSMPTEISNIVTKTESLLKPSEYPDYVRTEINRVADEVRKVLTDDSLISICLSDSHYPADEYTRKSGLHAMMAIKGLTYLLPVDFIAHLGDVGFEGNSSTTTTTDVLETNLIEMLNYVKESNGDSIPLFVAIGNHDSGNYITTSDNSDMLKGDWLYNNFTALSASNDTVFSGEANGGYCYRDFTDKKVRVFLLNTSEEIITGGYANDKGASQTQLSWFASKLQELNTKSDASKWGIIVLCHYPADYGAARPLSNTIAAYVKGNSITLNGNTYNFSGKNAAKFIVQHHGHIHNFLVDKLYTGSTPVQYDAYRVGIPNTQNNRENYYGEFNGVQYSEEENQTKTPNTVEDTSFVVNVINPSEEKIYSFYYGKGRNRIIGYGGITYYSITSNLSNTTSSNDAVSIEQGQSYTTTITIPDGYSMNELVVTMGGTNVTNSVYSNGVINIPEVIGNIVIIAKASKIPTSNLRSIAYSFEPNSTAIYNNGLGYKNNCRISGNIPDVWEETRDGVGYVMTGCIPWNPNTSINIFGATLDTNDSKVRMQFTNNARDYIHSPWILGGTSEEARKWETSFTITSISDGTKTGYKLTPKKTNIASNATYFFMSLKGSGEDLIITFGDEQFDATQYYTITNNLINVTTDNSVSSVDIGSSYIATLTVEDGYELSSIKVVMGGVDITSSAYSNGVVSISEVAGNVVITAMATIIQTGGYTNMIPLSTTTLTGTELYNPPYGYKTGTRINSSKNEVESEYMCCTGYIPLNKTDDGGDIIRIKNVTIPPSSGGATPYFILFNENGTVIASSSTLTDGETFNNLATVTRTEDIITITTLGIKNVKIYACRLSFGVIDDTSVVTVNQEIVDD